VEPQGYIVGFEEIVVFIVSSVLEDLVSKMLEQRPRRGSLSMSVTTKRSEEHEEEENLAPPGGGVVEMKVVQQPLETFFKDEGGKANHLMATVQVGDLGKVGGQSGVRALLCFENGTEIEDAQDFFEILDMQPNVLTASNSTLTVKYRINKVSRRKDGRRFSLKVALDDDAMGYVFTNPVMVLSKRKNQHFDDSSTASDSSFKVRGSKRKPRSRKREPEVDASALRAQVIALEKKLESLVKRVTCLEEREQSSKRHQQQTVPDYFSNPAFEPIDANVDMYTIDFSGLEAAV